MFTPSGVEARCVDASERPVAQRGGVTVAQGIGARQIHRDEPLVGGTEDRRRFVAPTVWVTVADRRVRKQRPGSFERGDDLRVRFPDGKAAEFRQIRGEAPVALDRGEDRLLGETRGDPDAEVVFPIGGGRMDDAGAGGELDVGVGQDG
ncbi:hypothetical protein [Hydrogenophilus thermoluteolus]|uniref:hypothetical protein n=1 Tax=Hydrogenophilus thermoluteolus TaxID=297 RepID=UPI002555AD90|nr:hypothetical protein [Hydrogenophilus thermoluteolus]